jgi:phosphopantothenoylcysteine synthetase/decarboxylase
MSSRALVVIVTGSAAAVGLPDYLAELGQALECPLTVLLTETAERFVDPEVASWFADEVLTRDTPGLDPVELARTAGGLVVLPASGHTLACAALGLMGTPATAALAEAPTPSLYFPAMSAVVWGRAAIRRHVADLREQGDTVVEPRAVHVPGGESAVLPPAPAEVAATVLDFLADVVAEVVADLPTGSPVVEMHGAEAQSLHG